MNISGYVAPGFEPVRDMFENNFRLGHEAHAQLSVYVAGEQVIDLWGSSAAAASSAPASAESFGPNSLVNVFSSTKCLTSIVIAKLVDEGRISYDTKISTIWPEFGANGKEHLTLADLLRHETGLSSFDTTLPLEDLASERIKQNSIAPIIARQEMSYREGGDFHRREYHSLTRGFIANEIVRRVDAKGRTIGEFLKEEITEPMKLDAYIGIKDDLLNRVQPLESLSQYKFLALSFIPQWLGRQTEANFLDMLDHLKTWRQVVLNSSRRDKPPPPPLGGVAFKDVGLDIPVFFNDAKTKAVEIPSANGHASARALSALASLMANGGVFGDFRLLSDATCADFHADPVERNMGSGANFFTRGGVAYSKMPTQPTPKERSRVEGMEGFYGWGGLGGSSFMWNLEEKIGFVFIPSFLFWVDIRNERSCRLIKEVLRCVKRRKQESQ